MKKVFSVLFAAAVVSLCACGGSGSTDEAKEMADSLKEKAKMDSIFEAANKNMDAASDSGATHSDSSHVH